MLLTRLGSALALLLGLALLTPAQAQSVAGKGNLLPPITGAEGWALTVTPPAKATLKRQARAVVVTVTAAGDQPQQAQLAYSTVELTDGQAYTLRFRAKADAPREMRVVGGITKPDFHDVGLSQTVSLTADWKDYALTFTAHNTVAGQISVPQFRVGKQKGRVWLADVTLIPNAAKPSSAAKPTAPAAPNGIVDAVSPGLKPSAGETLLEGSIREMRPAQKQFVLLVTRVIAANGTAKDIEPPRQQVISARPDTELQRLPDKKPLGTNPLVTLQPGDRIAVLGPPPPSGKALAAHSIVIASKGTTPASAPDGP
ncbi:MAG: carbohydrate binding domain-containing protein [Armatimonadota bacterium]|nr:carbohydrate binding domain-containing protein [Armatimonadota bacterium]